MAEKLLQVSQLKTYFFSEGGRRIAKAVDGVTFSLDRGESLGIVGESGSGKTTVCLSIVRVLPPAARIIAGRILFDGEDLLTKTNKEMGAIRGRHIGSVVQDPLSALNPLFDIGDQVAEIPKLHLGLKGEALSRRVIDLLHQVEIPSPEVRMRDFPHQISGGMRQRIVGSVALSGQPKLIIADEPTTNLDTTTQAQYLELLHRIRRKFDLSLIFITHNLGIVAKVCETMAVMYAGRIVEIGPVEKIFYEPQHPYTAALLNCTPKIGPKTRLQSIPGQPPDLSRLPAGCSFHPRCARALDRCRKEKPGEVLLGNGHGVSCWLLARDG